jgi:hypothetical protein
MGKGFGKADRLITKVTTETRLREAERKAKDVFDDRFLSDADWEFLLMDAAVLAGVFAANEFGLTHRGSRLNKSLGATILTKGEDRANGVVLQIQTTGSEPPFEAVGVIEGPEWSDDTNGIVEYVNKLLAEPAYAFTARWRDKDGKRHQIADYGLTPEHCSQKADDIAEGGELIPPVAVSEHPSLGAALCFAHALNKNTGKLFGGRPYEDIHSIIREAKT